MIYFNIPLIFDKTGDVWIAENGEKKLIVANKTNFVGFTNKINGRPFYKEKGSESYIFLEDSEDSNTYGVFLNRGYGYRCLNREETKIFESFCELGSLVFKFGIYKVGAFILEHNVKKRYGDFVWVLEDRGWICKGLYPYEKIKEILKKENLKENHKITTYLSSFRT